MIKGLPVNSAQQIFDHGQNLAQTNCKAASLAHRGDLVQTERNMPSLLTRAGWRATGKTGETCGNGGCRVLGEAGRASRPVALWSLGVSHRSHYEPPFKALARRNFFWPERTVLGQRGHLPRRPRVGRAGSIRRRRGWLDPAEREIQIFFPDPV